MTSKITPALLLAALVSACATTEPGWSGAGATPFGTAERTCRAETDGKAAEEATAAFEACMARNGWTRPR